MSAKQAEYAFDQVNAAVQSHLINDEYVTIEMWGEESQFIRFNRARVRQTGTVMDGELQISLMTQQRTGFYKLPFTGEAEADVQQALTALVELRKAVMQLPIDPYLVLPEGNATSREIHAGQLLTADQSIDAILPEVKDLDFTGIYAGGLLLQAYADSAGQSHWFATESFSLDYSIFTPDGQAIKGTFAGSHWDQSAYLIKLSDARLQLDRLNQPPKLIPKGQYRTYFAPAAVADLTAHLSWSSVGEASMQQGDSALLLLQRGEKQFSPAFTLKENFQRGLVPRFNEIGEIAPLELPIIVAGKLVNTLVSSRTAKEYGKTANGASSGEYLRSPEIAAGTLIPEAILKTLDRGLYLSNLHYLNWSDRPTARMTGMTRYACFWVENGEIVAPIENLRFDESLYRCLGSNLIALTDLQEFIPDVETYDRRGLGGVWTPGMLVEDFTYTL